MILLLHRLRVLENLLIEIEARVRSDPANYAEFGQMFANDLGNVSVVPGVKFDSPILGEIADINKQAIPYMMLVYFRYQEPSGSVLLQEQVQKMMAGETTPEAAATAITKGIATYYAPFQK